MNYKDKLSSGAAELGINLTAEQLNQFSDYLDLLTKWNQQINLTAVEDPHQIIIKHFLDSLSLLTEIDLDATYQVIDVGTGAGLPGLPLKIVRPQLELTLLEAVQKKTTFLRQVIYRLELDKVEVIHGRAEDYAHRANYREEYDYGLARAVAELNTLVEYGLPFIRPGGKFAAYKSQTISSELETSRSAIEQLGGQLAEVAELQLPLSELQRKLVVIDKLKATSDDYPRSAGKPSKQPL